MFLISVVNSGENPNLVSVTRFGFSPEFTKMIRNIQTGTTAHFLVSGELSTPREVISGIRQGCPLTPLLFIIAAEVLALTNNTCEQITGIKVPNRDGARHKFSAFVDDTTVFLHEAAQLPAVLQIVEQFGKL